VSLYLIAVIGAILFWSTSFVGTKLAFDSFPPITVGALRFLIATILLGGIVLSVSRHRVIPEKNDLKSMALCGFLGVTLYFSMENIGIRLTSASNAALIVASYPAITAFLERIIYKISISKYQLFGIITAIVGVSILTNSNENPSNHNEIWGDIILITTGFVWAIYTFTTRKLVNKYSTITSTFYQTLFGTLFFIPLAFFEIDKWNIPTLHSIIYLFYLAIFCSVIAFVLYNFGLKKLSSSITVSLMNLVPVFGVIFSIIVLNESIGIKQLIGGLIIIVGVFFSVKKFNVQ